MQNIETATSLSFGSKELFISKEYGWPCWQAILKGRRSCVISIITVEVVITPDKLLRATFQAPSTSSISFYINYSNWCGQTLHFARERRHHKISGFSNAWASSISRFVWKTSIVSKCCLVVAIAVAELMMWFPFLCLSKGTKDGTATILAYNNGHCDIGGYFIFACRHHIAAMSRHAVEENTSIISLISRLPEPPLHILEPSL